MSYMTHIVPIHYMEKVSYDPLTSDDPSSAYMEQVFMVPPHVLYDSYGPLHTSYGIGILWFPLPYMEQVSYGPATCMYGPHI